MNELLKFAMFVAMILLVMLGISKVAKWYAEKRNVNHKVVGWVLTFIVFLICSALWSFTPVYDYISQITGVPLAK